MSHRTIPTLTWKAVAALLIALLGAGFAGTTAFLAPALIAEHEPADTGPDSTEADADLDDEADVDDDDEDDGDVVARSHTDGEHPDHPDSFGAIVSADARDGGVDGQEISELAHDRNAERADDGLDESDDEHGPSDAGLEHGQGQGLDDDED
jgi:hypothetical protein